MTALVDDIKALIITSLDLEDVTPDEIGDDEPLFGDGLGLDSIDALELGVALQKAFDIKIQTKSTDMKQHFATVSSLAAFVSDLKDRETP